MIILTLSGEEVYMKKIIASKRVGIRGFLESMKKNSRIQKPVYINISPNKIQLLERGKDNIRKFKELHFICDNLVLNLDKKLVIERLLDSVFYNNVLSG